MFQLLLAIIYLAFISLGLPDALLGSAWPTMYQELGTQFCRGIFGDHCSRYDYFQSAK